ncbi:MAG: ABC transporter ATP-binding protein, partial [Chloroflexi bacterium]|nr:ABC transporter ATP-binding protein [Chloroflexota bacterium]
MTTTEPLIRALNVSRNYHLAGEEVQAVRDVSLNIPTGIFIAFVGRSGSGKTTLLNLLAGLDSPTEGTVLFEGRDLATFNENDMVELRRHRLGFVFQSFGLLPLLSAYENEELLLRISGVGAGDRARRTKEVRNMVGLLR